MIDQLCSLRLPNRLRIGCEKMWTVNLVLMIKKMVFYLLALHSHPLETNRGCEIGQSGQMRSRRRGRSLQSRTCSLSSASSRAEIVKTETTSRSSSLSSSEEQDEEEEERGGVKWELAPIRVIQRSGAVTVRRRLLLLLHILQKRRQKARVQLR